MQMKVQITTVRKQALKRINYEFKWKLPLKKFQVYKYMAIYFKINNKPETLLMSKY